MKLAIDALQEKVRTDRELYGVDSPETLSDMINLAKAYREIRDFTKAREILETVLDAQIRTLGSHDDKILATKHSLGWVLYEMGELERAHVIQEEVLKESTARYGLDSDIAVAAMLNLSTTLNSLSRYREALLINQMILDARRSVFGESHEETLRAMSSLALTKRALGDYDSAREIDDLVLIRALALNADPRAILDIRRHIYEDSIGQGKWSDAAEEAVAIFEGGYRDLGPTDELRKHLELNRRKYKKLLRMMKHL
jgi:tetratricopeptide (TPR) repeat protein